MRRLRARIENLETRKDLGVVRWHQVIQQFGESEQDAVAKYERRHGPIGDDGCIVFRVFVAPER